VTFAHPWLLLLLVIPLLLVAWIWRRGSGAVVLPFDHSRARGRRVLQALVNVAETAPPLVAAVAVIVLAGPQCNAEPHTRRVLTNIEFCIDVSGSMMSQFGDGTRYDGSMKAINDFLDFRQGDAFGLTFFGNSVLHWVPLTTDTSAVRCAPPFMRPGHTPPWLGGTEIGKALLACRDVLRERQEGDRMIVMISDGDSFDLDGGNDMVVGQKLREDNITLYHIHVAEGEVPEQVTTITTMTGGEAFPVGDPSGLRAVFEHIDKMRQTKLEKITTETLDDYAPWCWAGLSLVGLALLCAFGLRYTPW
jgi:Ca-activated chloride channel family protein